MVKLVENWREIIKNAYEEIGIITENTKKSEFIVFIGVSVGVKNNGINFCEIKLKLK